MKERLPKRLLRARRREMRLKLKERRARVKKQIQKTKSPLTQKYQKHRMLIALSLLALLLALISKECNCETQQRTSAPVPAPPFTKSPKPSQPKTKTRAQPKGRLETRIRPTYKSLPPKPQHWVANFKLQVAARSPRLATCFEGSEQPGALKWIATIAPAQGEVLNQDFETFLGAIEISKQQRACLEQVLKSPAYRLPKAKANSPSSRIGIVIEF